MVNSFWQSLDAILEDVSVTEAIIQRLLSFSVFKNYCSLTCVQGGFKTQPQVDRRFCPVPGGCHSLDNRNRPEPDGAAGQLAVGFWSRP